MSDPQFIPPPVAGALDVESIRRDFPILAQSFRGKRLAYLDSAASTQKPLRVIEAISGFYTSRYANIHRGAYTLSELATDAYEEARRKTREFINAEDEREIIFVRGTTEAVNLVAQTFGRMEIGTGDAVVISAMEHHSNIVPWQMICEEKGAVLKVIPMNDRGELLLDEYEKLLTDSTRIVAIAHISNALGTINPVRDIIELAHRKGIPVLLDGAQTLAHLPVDVRDLDCDFYAFSAHKMYGPTGIGVLYGKRKLLEAMPPYQGGGDMIRSVTFEKTIYNDLPYKFEAGTPHIAGGVGLAAAIDYLSSFSRDAIIAHENRLLDYATRALLEIPGLRLVGTARDKAGVISFVIDYAHPHDIATILDTEGVAVRSGHHCAQPVMQRFNVPATTRASFGIYNTVEDVDQLVNALQKVREIFA